MTTRIGIIDGANGLPIISKVVARDNIVYVYGVTPESVGDVAVQTNKVLEHIDRLLQPAGTGKSKLLTAQVWLSDMASFAADYAAWNAWVDSANPPVRACVQTALWKPNMPVEIMVTAAK